MTTTDRRNDCVYIDGQPYDVASWAEKHPGGEVMMRFLGRDATAAFAAFHGKKAAKTLRAFRPREAVAPVEPESTSEIERDFAELRDQAEAEGLFAADRSYFIKRGMLIGALAGGAALSVAMAPTLLWAPSALMLGLAWEQAGWLAHDVLHHSVTTDRAEEDRWGLLFGNVVLGFSCDWWKRKHNTHHAMPNVVGRDPDIDTLPLLSFTEHEAPTGPLSRLLVKLQPATVLPILAFARTNWVVQSVAWAATAPRVRGRRRELMGLAVHHALSVGLLSLLPSWPLRLGYFALSQLSSGLMTGAVFVVGHNAREMFTPREEQGEATSPGFYELQIRSTQNIATTWATRWFYGGLEGQIEHHLFPMMPRHNHEKVRERVKALCAKHGLDYVERGFFEGLRDVVGVLRRVARAAG